MDRLCVFFVRKRVGMVRPETEFPTKFFLLWRAILIWDKKVLFFRPSQKFPNLVWIDPHLGRILAITPLGQNTQRVGALQARLCIFLTRSQISTGIASNALPAHGKHEIGVYSKIYF